MTLPASTTPWLSQALIQVLGQAAGIKGQATTALSALQAGSVNTQFIFNVADVSRDAISRFNQFKVIQGLDAYATQQVPGYAGTMTADITATVTAIQDCIDWIVANFPKDTTDTWLLAFSMAADGTRSPRTFTPAQTAGLQTRLQTVIGTISS